MSIYTDVVHRTDDVLDTALSLSLAWCKGNYIRTLRLARRLPCLHISALHRHLDIIRRFLIFNIL